MSTIVIRPGPQNVHLSAFAGALDVPSATRSLGSWLSGSRAGGARALATALADLLGRAPAARDVCAVWCPYGGPDQGAPVVASPVALAQVRRNVAGAPLHVPLVVTLCEALAQALPAVPVVIVFETAFFTRLPLREQLYALDAQTRRSLGLRRAGFHGITHRAACAASGCGHRAPRRILSVCLEPRPELAAVLGQRPVMVSSGWTPLEGLPGEHDCGELDPGLVLALARAGMGPEAIDRVLTKESGLSALAGRAVTLPDVLAAHDGALALAGDYFVYRLVLTAGAGVAALGGLDALVFSGRYATAGRALAERVVPRLCAALRTSVSALSVSVFERTLESLVAEAALDHLAQHRHPCVVGA